MNNTKPDDTAERFRFLVESIRDYAIFTLDRVVCCYSEMEPLVRLSAERCRRLYGGSYPRYRWPVRAVVAIENFFRRLFGNPFRSFVHSVDAMDALIRASGFALLSTVRTFAWEIAVYERRVILSGARVAKDDSSSKALGGRTSRAAL